MQRRDATFTSPLAVGSKGLQSAGTTSRRRGSLAGRSRSGCRRLAIERLICTAGLANSRCTISVCWPQRRRAIVKATGTLGPNASELLQELEQAKYLSSALLAKVNRISIVYPPVSAAFGRRTNRRCRPCCFIRMMPRHWRKSKQRFRRSSSYSVARDQDPITETINGVKVRLHTLVADTASPTGLPDSLMVEERTRWHDRGGAGPRCRRSEQGTDQESRNRKRIQISQQSGGGVRVELGQRRFRGPVAAKKAEAKRRTRSDVWRNSPDGIFLFAVLSRRTTGQCLAVPPKEKF